MVTPAATKNVRRIDALNERTLSCATAAMAWHVRLVTKESIVFGWFPSQHLVVSVAVRVLWFPMMLLALWEVGADWLPCLQFEHSLVSCLMCSLRTVAVCRTFCLMFNSLSYFPGKVNRLLDNLAFDFKAVD